jgi:uncharacterized membrane protein YcaP (DUF421 family)
MMEFLQRITLGDLPWDFVIEVVWRALVMYALLLVAMRLMGKRVAAQLSISELSVVLMLGAAIGVPIQVSSQGILPAIVVLATVVALQSGLSWLSMHHRRITIVAEGEVRLLLQDGRMLLDALYKTQLSREMLASELRSRDIAHLGELRRVYIEANGQFSLVKFAEPRPGLTVSPDNGDAFCHDLEVPGHYACWSCGYTERSEDTPRHPCEKCSETRWVRAVTGVRS